MVTIPADERKEFEAWSRESQIGLYIFDKLTDIENLLKSKKLKEVL